MKIVYAACALLLLAVFAAPPAEAKGRAKAPKKLYETNWGRRSDLTQRFWPVHQHPYVRF
jgi:hypothetical protein